MPTMEAQEKQSFILALEEDRNLREGSGRVGTPGFGRPLREHRLPAPSPGPPLPSASGPRGLSPRLAAPAGSDRERGRARRGQQGPNLAPAAPYLGSGRSGRARSVEFADSGQSTRTGSGGRGRRTEAQRERLTDPGSGHGACAARRRGLSAHARRWARAPRGRVGRLFRSWRRESSGRW